MGRRGATALAALLALAAGCASSRPHYGWGRYPEVLFAHYQAPQDREAFVAGLWATLQACEQEGLRVPPGLYAEYGYALLEEGRNEEAVGWFEREAAAWPESRILMQKLVRVARQRPAAPPSTGPAGALEDRGGAP